MFKRLYQKTVQAPSKHASYKRIYRFQEPRPGPPGHAIQTRRSEHRAQGKTVADSESIHCPTCLHKILMEHGDRVYCSCHTIIETYGNSLRYWRVDGKHQIEVTALDRLLSNPELAELYHKHPSIQDAVDNLAVLIKLHKNL